MPVVTIKVTRNYIHRGNHKKCYTCPVALAIRKVGVAHVEVNEDDVILRDADDRRDFRRLLPKKVKKFIERFDAFLDVKPFEFKLNIPKKVLLPSPGAA